MGTWKDVDYREKARLRAAAWRKKNKNKVASQRKRYKGLYARSLKIKQYYGISLKVYRALELQQKFQCAICKKKFGKYKLCVDHSHKTKVVRGLLCQDCNLGLGKFRDSVDRLKMAVSYLQEIL